MMKGVLVLRWAVAAVVVGMAAAAFYEWQVDKNDTLSLAAVGVGATFALATAAILTLEQNRALMSQNERLVVASADEAKASREMVEEARRDRQLAFTPRLTWVFDGSMSNSQITELGLVVENVGPGVAINVVACAHQIYGDQERWWSSDPFELRPMGTWPPPPHRISLADTQAGRRFGCVLEDLIAADRTTLSFAIRYQDLLGTWYRFPGGAAPSQRDPVRWVPGEDPQPSWASCG
jgi:hypothetical protein